MNSRKKPGDPARLRQSLARSTLTKLTATVLGLDAVGRQIAVQLAALGVQRLQLVDSRLVSSRTYAVEGFHHDDVGRPKVHATDEQCHQINPLLEIQTHKQRSLRDLDLGDAVYACASRIRESRYIERLMDTTGGFAVFCHLSRTDVQVEVTSDLSSLEAIASSRDKATRSADLHVSPSFAVPAASIAAGLVVAEFVRFVEGKRPHRKFRVVLKSLKISVE